MTTLNISSYMLPIIIAVTFGWMLNEAFTITAEQPLASDGSLDVSSPSDIVAQDKIHLFSDRIVIEVDNPQWATFTDTNSMDPVLDKGAHALQVIPESPSHIELGDIISYEKGDDMIIHRVIETGYDDDGWYARTKGDNNKAADEGKVRFSQVKKLLIGIIY